MQCINNNFHREQIQTPPMLTEKETKSSASIKEDKSLLTNNSGKITENVLPSFSATSSLVCNADLTRTDVYLTPLIPGAANSYSVINTALIRAHNISTRAIGTFINGSGVEKAWQVAA